MSLLYRATAACLLVLVFSLPLSASAANVFGGKVGAFFPCFNAATWNSVGPPRGGLYIDSFASTRAYPYGRPGPGKYVLGLYGIPYFCIVLIAPLFVLPGVAMTMVGSSR
jgi:hypothetical protein